VRDDEGAFVLAGTDGVISRRLLRTDGERTRPLEHYRLTLFVRLHEAAAAELHYGWHADQITRLVVRVTAESVALGRRTGDRGLLELHSDPQPIASGKDRARVLSVERQRDSWWIFFDEQLVGTVAADPAEQLPEFRLLVEGGTAWFSDLHVDELGPGEAAISKSDRRPAGG
jgi:hypothetical protein